MSTIEAQPYRRTPKGRMEQAEAFGLDAVKKLKIAEPHLDSLSDERLLRLHYQVIGQMARYAERSLHGKNEEDHYGRQHALNILSCEVGTILDSRNVELNPSSIEPTKPILERVLPKELARIHQVLCARVDSLVDAATKPGLAPEARGAMANRIAMLSLRHHHVGTAYFDWRFSSSR